MNECEYEYGALVGWLNILTVKIIGTDGFSDYSQSLIAASSVPLCFSYESGSKENFKNAKKSRPYSVQLQAQQVVGMV